MRPTTTSSSSRVSTSRAKVWPAFHSLRSRRIVLETDVSDAGSSPCAGAALHGRKCVWFSRSDRRTLPTSDERGGRRTSRSVSRRVESEGGTSAWAASVMKRAPCSQQLHRVDVDRRPHVAPQRLARIVYTNEHAPERESFSRSQHDAKPIAASDSSDGSRRRPLHDDHPRPNRLAGASHLRELLACCPRVAFVGCVDADERRSRERRVVELSSIAELAIQKAVDVVARCERDSRVI